jgi:hypothetical protein
MTNQEVTKENMMFAHVKTLNFSMEKEKGIKRLKQAEKEQ